MKTKIIGLVVCVISLLVFLQKVNSDRVISKSFCYRGDEKGIYYLRAKALKDIPTMESQLFRAISLWQLGQLATEASVKMRQDMCVTAYEIVKEINQKAPGYKNVGTVLSIMEKAKK